MSSVSVAEIAAAALALTFASAGFAKVAGFRRWRRAPASLELPATPAAVGAFAVPPLEVVAATLLLLGPPRAGAGLAIGLLAGFSVVLLRARSLRGDRLPCACFGGQGDWDYRLLLARNAVFAALAAVVLLAPVRARGLEAFGSPGAGDALPLGLTAGGLVVAFWMIQQARIALRREDLG
jgi:hypothetical protein